MTRRPATPAELEARHARNKAEAARTAKVFRRFDASKPEEEGFTIRHAKGRVTYPVPLLVDALQRARRLGFGWYVTRDSADKFGRRHVPMSWVPRWQPAAFDEGGPCWKRVKLKTQRNKAHDF